MSQHTWRDAGGGKIRCDKTGETTTLSTDRRLEERTIKFTPEEWKRLERLAAWRSTSKRKLTPEDCVREMIATCLTGPSGWVHP